MKLIIHCRHHHLIFNFNFLHGDQKFDNTNLNIKSYIFSHFHVYIFIYKYLCMPFFFSHIYLVYIFVHNSFFDQLSYLELFLNQILAFHFYIDLWLVRLYHHNRQILNDLEEIFHLVHIRTFVKFSHVENNLNNKLRSLDYMKYF